MKACFFIAANCWLDDDEVIMNRAKLEAKIALEKQQEKTRKFDESAREFRERGGLKEECN